MSQERPDPSASTQPGSASSRVFRNAIHLAGGQAAATGAAVVWLYFVPRAIGPTGVGELAIATAVSFLVGTVIQLGIGTLLTRDIARNPTRAGSLVGSGLLLRLGAILPSVAIIALYIRLVHVDRVESILIWLGAAAMLISAASGVIQAAFAGLEQMQYLAYANALGNGLVRLAAIVVVLVGLGVVEMMEANLVLTATLLVLNVIWMRGHFSVKWQPNPAELRYMVRSSLPFWIGGLVFTTYLWIDTVILSVMAPVHVVGWYNTPIQIFATLLMVASVVGTAWFPRFARAFNDGAESLSSVARPALEMIVLISLPVSAGLASVAVPLISSLYGPSFNGSGPVLIVLAITMVPTFFNMLAYWVLLSSNRQNAWIKVVVVATVLNIALNVTLVSWFQGHVQNGALGSAISLLATEIFETVCAILLMRGVMQPAFAWRLGKGLLATGVMTILVLLASRFGLVVQVAVGMLSFAPLALLLRLPSETEMTQLRMIGSRLRRSSRPAEAAA